MGVAWRQERTKCCLGVDKEKRDHLLVHIHVSTGLMKSDAWNW